MPGKQVYEEASCCCDMYQLTCLCPACPSPSTHLLALESLLLPYASLFHLLALCPLLHGIAKGGGVLDPHLFSMPPICHCCQALVEGCRQAGWLKCHALVNGCLALSHMAACSGPDTSPLGPDAKQQLVFQELCLHACCQGWLDFTRGSSEHLPEAAGH